MSAADSAIAFALAQVGKPYKYGATGPNSYDCSGLFGSHVLPIRWYW
jgi:cell wall-associated NlpC family hydrolase